MLDVDPKGYRRLESVPLRAERTKSLRRNSNVAGASRAVTRVFHKFRRYKVP